MCLFLHHFDQELVGTILCSGNSFPVFFITGSFKNIGSTLANINRIIAALFRNFTKYGLKVLTKMQKTAASPEQENQCVCQLCTGKINSGVFRVAQYFALFDNFYNRGVNIKSHVSQQYIIYPPCFTKPRKIKNLQKHLIMVKAFLIHVLTTMNSNNTVVKTLFLSFKLKVRCCKKWVIACINNSKFK